MSDIGNILGYYVRRGLVYRWIVLVPTVLVFALVTMYVTIQPDTYESNAVLMKPITNPGDNETRAEARAIAKDMFRSAAERLLSTPVLSQVAEKTDPYPALRQAKGMGAVVERLRANLRVDISRGTGSITVTCSQKRGENPAEMAANIVNTLTTLFVHSQREALEDRVKQRKQFLDKEKARTHAELELAQNRLDGFKTRYRNSLPDDEATNQAQIDRLSRDVQDYKLQQRVYEARIGALERELARLDLDLNSVAQQGDASVRAAVAAGKRRVEDLKLTLKDLEYTFKSDTTPIKKLRNRIKNLEQQNESITEGSNRENVKKRVDYIRYLMDETRSSLDRAQAEIKNLDKRVLETNKKVEDARQRIFTSARIYNEYVSHQRKVVEAETRYNQIVARHNLADQRARGIDYTSGVAPIQVEQSAFVPAKPASPDRLVSSLMGLVIGLGVGVGLAVARHKLDNSYHRPDDLRALLPGAVLVTVPEIKAGGARFGVLFAALVGGLVLTSIFAATVAVLGVQVGWWGEPEMIHTLIDLR